MGMTKGRAPVTGPRTWYGHWKRCGQCHPWPWEAANQDVLCSEGRWLYRAFRTQQGRQFPPGARVYCNGLFRTKALRGQWGIAIGLDLEGTIQVQVQLDTGQVRFFHPLALEGLPEGP